MEVERITKAQRFTRREVSEALGVTVRTVTSWTAKPESTEGMTLQQRNGR